MRPSAIVHLDSYRERKEARLRHTLALYGQDAERSRLLLLLGRAVALVAGDRGAVVWVDEYGPGLPRAHVLLDLASDRPRRLFPASPLQAAWNAGVPGLLDIPDSHERPGRTGDGVRSLCAVALGSDGPHSWFLVVDSLTPRPPLSARATGDLMFLAGELTALLLHRDLDHRIGAGELGGGTREHFAGWPILQDIEGRKEDGEAGERIAARFLVGRVLRGLVDDGLVSQPDSLAYQIAGVRRETAAVERTDPEARAWDRVLAALEASGQDDLVPAVLEWGTLVEEQGHHHGAREIHDLAYHLAVAAGAVEVAVDAARFQARVCRKLALWEDAVRWYDVARRVAEETESPRKLALVLDGMANMHRDRGNFPRARKLLQQVLELGDRHGDRHARAIAHHDLMVLEVWGGNLEAAILHGWEAVQGYDSRRESLTALFDLAGVLSKSGELGAAADAYSVVVGGMEGFDHRIMALDALAWLAARSGDRGRYLELRNRVDAEGWGRMAPVYQAQILYYRGLSCRALGWAEEGTEWLRRAQAYAGEHGLSKFAYDAEEALKAIREESEGAARPAPLGEGIQGVRAGLRELRETLSVGT